MIEEGEEERESQSPLCDGRGISLAGKNGEVEEEVKRQGRTGVGTLC